jgi:DNA-binding beta-propeller fold protein YncE
LIIATGVFLTSALTPALAVAQSPGALTQLASPNNCVESSRTESNECQTSADGINGNVDEPVPDVAVSPDGSNVYVISQADDSIAEFTRNPDGSLTPLGCIADGSDSDETSCSENASATGLVDPQAIAISPDGQNVYVAAEDEAENGDIAEFTRSANGTLTQVSGSDCIQEGTEEETGCDFQGARGLSFPIALAVSPDGENVYVADNGDDAITTLTRDATDGSLSEAGDDPANDCIQDNIVDSDECNNTANGLSEVTGVAVSPDGDDVYTAGAPNEGAAGSIAEFSRGDGGTLTSIGCVGTPENFDDESCSGGATGVGGLTDLVVSPDGTNVYTASEFEDGPIAEFSRDPETGTLTQLASPNDCIEESGGDFGCGSTATGIGDGYELAISPDGANVYAAAPGGDQCDAESCSDVAEFARDTANQGALTQLPNGDACIQETDAGSECPDNEDGTGLGGAGLAMAPDGGNVYVTGIDDIAEFGRATHTLTVALTGSGTGSVSDDTGLINCPSTCASKAFTANDPVTLTATPSSGSTFAGWGGACSGTGTCQVPMSADTNVTATFTTSATNPTPPSPGAPTPVLTGAPTAITDGGAGFTGSVNPEGLPTTVYFQYGLDKRYSQVGASGPNYTQQTPAQQLGAGFTTDGVGPVPVSGLIPNALYHVRLVATNSAGTAFGQDVTFKTELAPAPGSPTIGETFNLAPVSGLVFVLVHGQLVPLTQVEEIPSGTVIDALHGTFELIISLGGGSARDASAHGKPKTQSGKFGGAVVRIHQLKSGRNKALTTVMMVESAFKGAPAQSICTAPGSAADAHAAKLNSKVIQLLHASAHGKFATSGRYSAATVRGTVWDTIARCDGTLVKAIKDEVEVTDFIRHKTITLHAGQSYLAPGP